MIWDQGLSIYTELQQKFSSCNEIERLEYHHTHLHDPEKKWLGYPDESDPEALFNRLIFTLPKWVWIF